MKEGDPTETPPPKRARDSIILSTDSHGQAVSAEVSAFGQEMEPNNPYVVTGAVASNNNILPASADDVSSVSSDSELERELELELSGVGMEKLRKQQAGAPPIWLYKKARGPRRKDCLAPDEEGPGVNPYLLNWNPPEELLRKISREPTPVFVEKQLKVLSSGIQDLYGLKAKQNNKRAQKNQMAKQGSAALQEHNRELNNLNGKAGRLTSKLTVCARLYRAVVVQHEHGHFFGFYEDFSPVLGIPLVKPPSSASKTTYHFVKQIPRASYEATDEATDPEERKRKAACAVSAACRVRKSGREDFSEKQLARAEAATRCLSTGVEVIYKIFRALRNSSDSCSNPCQNAELDIILRQVFEDLYQRLSSGDLRALVEMSKAISEQVRALVADYNQPAGASDFIRRYYLSFKQSYQRHLRGQRFHCWESIGQHIDSAVHEFNEKDTVASATRSDLLASPASSMTEDWTPALLDSVEETPSYEYLPQQRVDEPYQVDQAESDLVGCVYRVDDQDSADDLAVDAFREDIQSEGVSSEPSFEGKRSYEDYATPEGPATCKRTKYSPAASSSSAALDGYSSFFAPGFSSRTQHVAVEVAKDMQSGDEPLDLSTYSRKS